MVAVVAHAGSAAAQTQNWSSQPNAGSCGASSGGQIIGAQTLGWASGALSGSIDGLYGPDTQNAIDHIWAISSSGTHTSGCMNSGWYYGTQTLIISINSGTAHPGWEYSGSSHSVYFDFSETAATPSTCTWTTDDYHTSLPLGGGLGLGHYIWTAPARTSTSVAGYADC